MVTFTTLLPACGHTEIHQVVFRQPGSPGRSAELYVGDRGPSRPFREMAIVQAIGYGSHANASDVTSGLVERASRLGCDAIVRVHVDQGYSMAQGTGVCVEWIGPGGDSNREWIAPPQTVERDGGVAL